MPVNTLAEQVEQSDPIVAMWLYECGLARRPVAIALRGTSREDIEVQIRRLVIAFGDLLDMHPARLSKRERAWVAHGTIRE